MAIRENGLEDSIVVVQASVEDLVNKSAAAGEAWKEMPEDNSCDFLISEWMGYALIYEKMLPSVILARDKWLKPGGKMLPNRARIHLRGFYDPHYTEARFGIGGVSEALWNILDINKNIHSSMVCQDVKIENVPESIVATSGLATNSFFSSLLSS